jgi:hypothetical protein
MDNHPGDWAVSRPDPRQPSALPFGVLEWDPDMAGERGPAATKRSDTEQPVRATKGDGKATDGAAILRPPRTSGPVVTDRDMDVIQWIGRHGIVTPTQVATHFFHRDDGTVGTWAAYRRLRILEQLGLLQRDRTFWRESTVLRITTAGGRIADLQIRPARLIPAEVRHALAVVDLVEFLITKTAKRTRVVTEREMRADRRRELRRDPRNSGLGRIPDAEFHLPSGDRIAIELDLTPKRSADYESILASYLTQLYDGVWWYVAPGVVPRLRKIVADNRADDFVSVESWKGVK